MEFIQHVFAVAQNTSFESFVEAYGYLGIYIWFISFDQLLPIPEEVSLLVLGYLCSQGFFNLFLAGFVAFAGFMSVDVFFYLLVLGGNNLFKKWFLEKESSFLEKYKIKFKNNLNKSYLLLSFTPRVRIFAPILAASMQVKFSRFVFLNSASIFLLTCVYLFAGYFFHKSLEVLIHDFEYLQTGIFGGVILIVVLFFAFKHR